MTDVPPVRLSPSAPRSPVIVADDDPALLQVIAEVLEEAGFDVLAVASGDEVLALLKSGVRPCLVLCDLVMPGLSVAELFAGLATDARSRHVPLVIMTGGRGEVLPQVAYVLQKPFTLTELVDVVSHASAMRRSAQSDSDG